MIGLLEDNSGFLTILFPDEILVESIYMSLDCNSS